MSARVEKGQQIAAFFKRPALGALIESNEHKVNSLVCIFPFAETEFDRFVIITTTTPQTVNIPKTLLKIMQKFCVM